MHERWQATYEWMGHMQDHARILESKLDRIISMLEKRERDAETLAADHKALAEQVQDHERRLRTA